MGISQSPEGIAFRSGALPSDPRHGTRHGYNKLGCRCHACSAASAEYGRELRARHAAVNPPRVRTRMPAEEQRERERARNRRNRARKRREQARRSAVTRESPRTDWPMPAFGGSVHAMDGGALLGTLQGVDYTRDRALLLTPQGERVAVPFSAVRAK